MPARSRITAVTLTLALVAALFPACGAGPTTPGVANQRTAPGRLARFVGDPRVLVYTSSDWGFSTNTFFLEGPTGLVALDTQFLPSAAEDAIQRAERETGKKVVGAVVLHVNPDKFNGTATFQKHGASVVTSAQVAALIPAVHTQRSGKFLSTFAPDYPTEVPQPKVFGDTTGVFEAGGLAVKLHVAGEACSKAHVIAEWDGHVFAGDLVANGHHSWLELGLVDAWRARLAEIDAMSPRFVHPGRGLSGGPELVVQERAYLDFVVAQVKAEPDLKVPMPDDALARLKAAVGAKYPGWDNAHFLRFGLPAVWRHEAEARSAVSPPPSASMEPPSADPAGGMR